MFEKGSIIIGKSCNHYGCTSDEALMVILESFGTSIDVLIIAHPRYDFVGNNHNVIADRFDAISIDEYFERYPMAHIISKGLFDEYVSDYSLEIDTSKLFKEIPTPVPYEISDELRASLLEEMKTLLKTYGYSPTDEGCNAIIDAWRTNKADIIRLFENHPNYNGKFQIVFDADYERELDKNEIWNFTNYLLRSNEIKDLFFEDYVSTIPYSYEECREKRNMYYHIFNLLDDYDYIKDINGLSSTDAQSKYYEWRDLERKYDDESYDWGGRRITRKSYKIYDDFVNIVDNFYNYYDSTLNESFSRYINNKFPEFKAKAGQKTSRALNKLCTMFGINKLPDYNAKFAKYSDAINPLTIKRYTVLSVNPIDYFTMSFGNSWGSCMTIDKMNIREMPNSYEGRYSGGTLSYMLDGTSMVFYTVDKAYEGTEYELQPKIQRNMFHYGCDKLIQGRVYPQSNDENGSKLYKRFRETVQTIIAECKGDANSWLNVKGVEECSMTSETLGTHYPDYLNFETCNVSYYNKVKNPKRIIIGSKQICPTCGEVHSRSSCIACGYCY